MSQSELHEPQPGEAIAIAAEYRRNVSDGRSRFLMTAQRVLPQIAVTHARWREHRAFFWQGWLVFGFASAVSG
jgi:hypothetical protein